MALPTGAWRLGYQGAIDGYQTSNTATDSYFTLSTANNTESDPYLTSVRSVQANHANQTINSTSPVYRDKMHNNTTDEQYYLNMQTSLASATSIDVRGDVEPFVVFAECAYL